MPFDDDECAEGYGCYSDDDPEEYDGAVNSRETLKKTLDPPTVLSDRTLIVDVWRASMHEYEEIRGMRVDGRYLLQILVSRLPRRFAPSTWIKCILHHCRAHCFSTTSCLYASVPSASRPPIGQALRGHR